MAQPFSTQKLARSPDFTDREHEVDRVLDAMRAAGRLVLYGERRMGKSSIIARAAERVEAEGGEVIVADAWSLDSLDDLNRRLMRAVPSSWLKGERLTGLMHMLRGFTALTVDDSGKPELALSGDGPASGHPGDRLERILIGLDAVARDHGSSVVVVIDEFQDIETLKEGSGGLLRSIVQNTPDLAYVFSGSIVGLVSDLLGPEGPFHAMDRLEIGGIDPEHLVPWIQHRFEANGVRIDGATVRDLYERSGPVTEYVMRLARSVHRRARTSGSADADTVASAFEELVADFAGSSELLWSRLSPSKKQIMRAVAQGHQELTARAVLDRFGLASSSAAQYAIDTLRYEAILAPGKPFRISDPYFAAWVRDGMS